MKVFQGKVICLSIGTSVLLVRPTFTSWIDWESLLIASGLAWFEGQPIDFCKWEVPKESPV